MTFRPSDDVLDEISAGQQNLLSWDENNIDVQGDSQEVPLNFGNDWNMEDTDNNQDRTNVWVEEVKAPDLPELLKSSDNIDGEKNWNVSENNVDNLPKGAILDQSQWGNVDNSPVQNNEISQQQPNETDFIEDSKISDAERSSIVSWVEGSINSNLDLLVDNNRLNIIVKYKKINRLFFRRWAFILFLTIGLVSWILLQVRAWTANNMGMVDESFIENKDKWREDTSDKVLSTLTESWVEIEVLVPYWAASIDTKSFQSKSNLISYKWLILPQLSSINFNSESIISLEDFDVHKASRKDIENAVNVLIKNNSIYRKTTNLPNVKDFRREGNSIEWSLIDWFNLGCINSSDKNAVYSGYLEIY